jgi:hypothetical protein
MRSTNRELENRVLLEVWDRSPVSKLRVILADNGVLLEYGSDVLSVNYA